MPRKKELHEQGSEWRLLSRPFLAVSCRFRLFQAFSHFLAFVHLPLLPCGSVLMAAERDTSITLAKERVFERQTLFQCISDGLYSGENFLRSLILLGKRSPAFASLSREKWPQPLKRRRSLACVRHPQTSNVDPVSNQRPSHVDPPVQIGIQASSSV